MPISILAERLSTVPGVGAGLHLRPEALRRARPGQPGGARRSRHRPRRRAQRARQRDRQPSRRARSRARTRWSRSTPTISCSTAPQYRDVIIAYRNGAPVRVKDVGDAFNSVQNMRLGAWFNNLPAEGVAINKAPGRQHRSTLVDRDQGADAAARAVDPAVGPCRPDVGPLADHSRRGARRGVHDAADDRPGRPGHLPLPADAVGDGHPEPGGAAVVARHLRVSCTSAATASTTSR